MYTMLSSSFTSLIRIKDFLPVTKWLSGPCVIGWDVSCSYDLCQTCVFHLSWVAWWGILTSQCPCAQFYLSPFLKNTQWQKRNYLVKGSQEQNLQSFGSSKEWSMGFRDEAWHYPKNKPLCLPGYLVCLLSLPSAPVRLVEQTALTDWFFWCQQDESHGWIGLWAFKMTWSIILWLH